MSLKLLRHLFQPTQNKWLLTFRAEIEYLLDYLILICSFVLTVVTINILLNGTSSIINGLAHIGYVLTLVICYIYRTKLVIDFKILIINLVAFFMGFSTLIMNGLAATSTMIFSIALFVDFIYLPTRKALLWFIFLHLLLVSFILLIAMGRIAFTPHLLDRINNPFFWVNVVFAFFFLSATAGILISYLRKQLSANIQRLEELAYQDQLTGLPNKLRFDFVAQRTLSYTTTSNSWIYLIDIKDMRGINAIYSINTGDEILASVGQSLKNMSNSNHYPAHFSGNEFIGLITFPTSEEAKNYLTIIINQLNQDMKQMLPEIRLDFHYSFMEIQSPYPSWDVIIRNIILAMRHSKEKHSNEIVLFQPWMQDFAQEELSLRSRIEHALENNSFILHYQPKIDISNGKVVGVEALARWSPDGIDYISPNIFIPLLTKYKLIIQFGNVIHERIIKDFPSIEKKYGTKIVCSINTSPLQFLMPGFGTMMATKVSAASIDPRRITLEITEDIFVEDLSTVKQIINTIHANGFGISLDDFGKGYSSLSYLSSLPLTEVKVDKSFIDTIVQDSRQFAMVKHICEIAELLNLTVIIEGVESQAQLDLIKQTRCKYVQGFLFGKPEPL
jgi:diguanylate cyclase (GGDEF)-like protein